MNEASINRLDYYPDYAYFIPLSGKDWQCQVNGANFSVKLTSEADSVATLQGYLSSHATLAVNCTHGAISANGVANSLISVSNGQPFSFRILRYNIEVLAGTTDGVLDFATNDPAPYLFELSQNGQTGYCKVMAS